MIREIYVCMCERGEIEYGFTYKAHTDDDNSLYDEPAGRTADVATVEQWISEQSSTS